MERIEPFFPLTHGVPRVEAQRVLIGIVYVTRNGLLVEDADMLLAGLSDETEEVIGDRSYDSNPLSLSLAERNLPEIKAALQLEAV